MEYLLFVKNIILKCITKDGAAHRDIHEKTKEISDNPDPANTKTGLDAHREV